MGKITMLEDKLLMEEFSTEPLLRTFTSGGYTDERTGTEKIS